MVAETGRLDREHLVVVDFGSLGGYRSAKGPPCGTRSGAEHTKQHKGQTQNGGRIGQLGRATLGYFF